MAVSFSRFLNLLVRTLATIASFVAASMGYSYTPVDMEQNAYGRFPCQQRVSDYGADGVDDEISLAITKTILGNSAPQANVFLGARARTAAMARLLNISVTAYPKKFDFCVVALPYVGDAIAEAKYCLDTLGRVVLDITTVIIHEGLYLGNSALDGFWSYINSRTDKPIIYVHPTSPYMKVDDKFVEANPTQYSPVLVEFYFETARCYMDLSCSGVLTKYTNIRWIAAHVGGAFPVILDCMIKSLGSTIEASLESIYNTRAYSIPKSQLLLGTDFPYAPANIYAGALAGLANDLTDFTQAKINNIILRNSSVALFGEKLNL
ncbi:hypothetical protein FRC00_011211 [Tulasnella sp. 408]|nr:hypothetical protein FRC00_011211 [Tulasnella sp. 408]